MRSDFEPIAVPLGGYEAFARQWSVDADHSRNAQRRQMPTVTWLGRVSLLLQIGGLNLLTDPTLADFAGPYGRFGAHAGCLRRCAGIRYPPLTCY